MVEIVEVSSESLRKEFVMIPYNIYKGNSYWIPPMIDEEIKKISPGKNLQAKGCESKFWVARKDGLSVGRIGAIIHKRYNEKTGEKYGRFTRVEFIDDDEVVEKLFEAAEGWIIEKGMTASVGPLGYSNIDTQGLLVEGFDQIASVASIYHHPYYKRQIERLGYEKYQDWVEFNLYLHGLPEKAERLSDLIQRRYNLRVVGLRKKKQIIQYSEEIFEILNKSFGDLFSFVEFDKEMIEEVVKLYLPVINPKLVHIVFDSEDRIVGFILPVPSLSRAMQKCGGRLTMRGVWAIKRSRTHNDTVDLFLTGVLPEYQSKGVIGLLIASTQAVMIEYGMTTVDTTGMLETNQKAIQHWKNYDNDQNKRKRCYIKYF